MNILNQKIQYLINKYADSKSLEEARLATIEQLRLEIESLTAEIKLLSHQIFKLKTLKEDIFDSAKRQHVERKIDRLRDQVVENKVKLDLLQPQLKKEIDNFEAWTSRHL